MATLVPFREFRANLSELIGRVEDHHERIVITVHGKPVAVLLGIYDFESMTETLEILSDPETVAALKEADEDIAAGRVYPDDASAGTHVDAA